MRDAPRERGDRGQWKLLSTVPFGTYGSPFVESTDARARARYAKLLMTIPGVGHYSALLVSSEIADIGRFPDHEHLCSYAKLSPGVRQSGETQHTTTGFGNPMLSWIMIQCTRVHVRRCDSAITRFYEQVSKRRGEKVAIVAAARKLMRTIYIMLKEEKAFRLDG